MVLRNGWKGQSQQSRLQLLFSWLDSRKCTGFGALQTWVSGSHSPHSLKEHHEACCCCELTWVVAFPVPGSAWRMAGTQWMIVSPWAPPVLSPRPGLAHTYFWYDLVCCKSLEEEVIFQEMKSGQAVCCPRRLRGPGPGPVPSVHVCWVGPEPDCGSGWHVCVHLLPSPRGCRSFRALPETDTWLEGEKDNSPNGPKSSWVFSFFKKKKSLFFQTPLN